MARTPKTYHRPDGTLEIARAMEDADTIRRVEQAEALRAMIAAVRRWISRMGRGCTLAALKTTVQRAGR